MDFETFKQRVLEDFYTGCNNYIIDDQVIEYLYKLYSLLHSDDYYAFDASDDYYFLIDNIEYFGSKNFNLNDIINDNHIKHINLIINNRERERQRIESDCGKL